MELSTAFQSIFIKFAKMKGSGITFEEAVALGEGTVKEAEKGKAYIRFEFDVAIGRKAEV